MASRLPAADVGDGGSSVSLTGGNGFTASGELRQITIPESYYLLLLSNTAELKELEAEKKELRAKVEHLSELRGTVTAHHNLLEKARREADSAKLLFGGLRGQLGETPPSYLAAMRELPTTLKAGHKHDVEFEEFFSDITSNSRLGYTTPQLLPASLPPLLSNARLKSYLGRGATAVGYTCVVPQAGGGAASGGSASVDLEARYAAKVFTHSHATELAALEADILRALAATPRHPAIPAMVMNLDLVATATTMDPPSPVLILAPLGEQRFCMPLAQRPPRPGSLPVTAKIFCKVVWALLDLHTRGWCHRDPRPENFFLTHDDKILLADVGSATRVGEAYPDDGPRAQSHVYGPWDALVYGEVWQAARHATYVLLQRPPRFYPKHDYEMVARMVYAASCMLHMPHTSNAWEVKQAWARHAQSARLISLLSRAEALGEAVVRDANLTQSTTIDAVAAFMDTIQAEMPPSSDKEAAALAQEQAAALANARAIMARPAGAGPAMGLPGARADG